MISWVRRATWRDWLRLIKRILPHAAIVMAGMLIVFFVIDRFNKPMGFLTNEFHKVLTFVLCLLTIDFAIQISSMQRRAERSAYQRQLRAQAKGGSGAHAPSQRGARPPHQPAGAGYARTTSPTRPQRAETGVRVTSRTGQGYRTRQ